MLINTKLFINKLNVFFYKSEIKVLRQRPRYNGKVISTCGMSHLNCEFYKKKLTHTTK